MNYDKNTLTGEAVFNKFDENTPTNLRSYNKGKIEQFDNEAMRTTSLKSELKYHPAFESQKSTPQIAEIDDIYFEPDFIASEFQTALTLLKESDLYCNQAILEFNKGNIFMSDDSIQQIQALVPELFCCRNLSEGFGAIVNAIQNALINNQGLPLSERQLLSLHNIIKNVRQKPFMKYDEAVDEIMELEDSGFIVEPQGFSHLAEILDEQ